MMFSFREFLRLVLGVDKLFRLEDPLGALSVNIFQPGDRKKLFLNVFFKLTKLI